MIIEIKDELNNIDINLSQITRVIEEKTNAYPNFNIFLSIDFVGGGNAVLKGWGLDKWRSFKKTINQ
jgi:hypothetical protein